MPAPSTWAMRLAEDLREIGEKLGYQSTMEEPPVEKSELKIDVVWKILTSGIKEDVSPLPKELIIISIEIQYSESQASISHGLVKAQYAGSPYHIIISYLSLTQDFKIALHKNKPVGLKIIDGSAVMDLQLWIQHMLI